MVRATGQAVGSDGTSSRRHELGEGVRSGVPFNEVLSSVEDVAGVDTLLLADEEDLAIGHGNRVWIEQSVVGDSQVWDRIAGSSISVFVYGIDFLRVGADDQRFSVGHLVNPPRGRQRNAGGHG